MTRKGNCDIIGLMRAYNRRCSLAASSYSLNQATAMASTITDASSWNLNTIGSNDVSMHLFRCWYLGMERALASGVPFWNKFPAEQSHISSYLKSVPALGVPLSFLYLGTISSPGVPLLNKFPPGKVPSAAWCAYTRLVL